MASTTLDWYGCATFGLRTAGLHIMLDAYIDRAANAAGPTPALSAADIDQCDYLIIGHSHFDHLFGAEQIDREVLGALDELEAVVLAVDGDHQVRRGERDLAYPRHGEAVLDAAAADGHHADTVGNLLERLGDLVSAHSPLLPRVVDAAGLRVCRRARAILHTSGASIKCGMAVR